MKIMLVNSDVVASYKSALLADLASRAVTKNKFFKLLASERYNSSYKPCLYLTFNSCINDGYINSNKAVADFFFSEYEYGEKHFDGKVDHVYPVVRLYPFSAEEVLKYGKFMDSLEFTSGEYATGTYSGCGYFDLLPTLDDNGEVERDKRYVETFEEEHTKSIYNSESGVYEDVVYTKKYEKHFFYSAVKLKRMSGSLFMEWLTMQDRVRYSVDKEKGEWYNSTFFRFVLSFTGGIWGVGIFFATTFITSLFFKKSEAKREETSNENIWSSDEDEDDDVLAVVSLPKY